jgi:hypothetical protein
MLVDACVAQAGIFVPLKFKYSIIHQSTIKQTKSYVGYTSDPEKG